MKEKYYLNRKILPTIPVPHDCIIKRIQLNDDTLIFIFEDSISDNDSIQSILPNAKSLIMKFHLIDDISDVKLYTQEKKDGIFHSTAIYKEIDLNTYDNPLLHLPDRKLEYLYHNIGYCSIIVKLWSVASIVMDITADYVEYDWLL